MVCDRGSRPKVRKVDSKIIEDFACVLSWIAARFISVREAAAQL